MPQYCYLGIDDGYFDIRSKKAKKRCRTVLVATVTCPHTLVAACIRPITVDALDALQRAIELIEELTSLVTIRAIFLDGVTFAGFNIIDPFKLYNIVEKPVITVFRYPLDLDKVLTALKNNFGDWRIRYATISKTYGIACKVLPDHNILIAPVGVSMRRAMELYNDARSYHPLPEALRLADCLASGLTKYLASQARSSWRAKADPLLRQCLDDEYTPFPRLDEESGQG